MRVQCEVCKGEEAAAVFCCADEAALCGSCDRRVHSANKLAGKHRRFSLLHQAASPNQSPLCDVCQEKQAFLFCQEDRAVLCRDCDSPIHDANELTRKHTRFLLLGIKLSPFAAPPAPEATASSENPSSVAYASSTASAEGEGPPQAADVFNTDQHRRKSAVVHCAPNQCKKPPPAAKERTKEKNNRTIVATVAGLGNGKMVGGDLQGLFSSASTTATATATGGSSISEYLMRELPGWQVEDLLLESCPAVLQTPGENLTPHPKDDLDDAAACCAFQADADDGGKPSVWWIPQVPQFSSPPVHGYDRRQQQHHHVAVGTAGGELNLLPARQLPHQFRQQLQNRRWTGDDGFTVPDLVAVHHNPPPYKRSRPSSWLASP